MENILESKREKKRQALIDAAEKMIRQGGLKCVKARQLAAHVGIALGQIYNLVGDLDEIILAVNSRTIHSLEKTLEQRLKALPLVSPSEKLTAIAIAYHHFARDNYHLWHALFDHQPLPEQKTWPDWVAQEHLRPFQLLEPLLEQLSRKVGTGFRDKNCGENKDLEQSVEPSETKTALASFCPAMTAQQLSIFTQTLFSAVHGIITLALDARDVGVPKEQIDAQLRLHITLICLGLKAECDSIESPLCSKEAQNCNLAL